MDQQLEAHNDQALYKMKTGQSWILRHNRNSFGGSQSGQSTPSSQNERIITLLSPNQSLRTIDHRNNISYISQERNNI